MIIPEAEVVAWAEHNFNPRTLVTATLGLSEEAGECCRAVLKDAQRIRGTHEEWMEELRKEIGDVFIKLVDVADLAGFDLEEAIKIRWEDVSQRDFVKDPKGHGISDDFA